MVYFPCCTWNLNYANHAICISRRQKQGHKFCHTRAKGSIINSFKPKTARQAPGPFRLALAHMREPHIL